jgi:hypothetical protein
MMADAELLAFGKFAICCAFAFCGNRVAASGERPWRKESNVVAQRVSLSSQPSYPLSWNPISKLQAVPAT